MAANSKRTEPLSAVDTAWLRMEHPTNLMMVTGILVFDRPLNFERLRATIEQRLLRFERFRQRVVTSSSRLRPPYWETDPHFTLSAHLHRIALPTPGDQATLQEMVSDLMSTPLDFSKPLWQYHLIENYGEGCVVLARLHHCIADGIALIHVLLSLTDDSPDAPWPDGHEQQRNEQRSSTAGPIAAVNATVRSAEKLLAEGIETLLDPSRIGDLAKLSAGSALALGKLLLMAPDPQTVFKGKLGVAKRAAWSQPIPLDAVKAIGRAVGGTINDVLLTAATGALRRYLQSRGETVDGLDLRAAVPVNLRSPDSPPELGNRFGIVFLPLPVGDEDPIDRLYELKERMEAIKGSPEALVAFGILNVMGMAPSQIEEFGLTLFGSKATAVMTNVPGPRQPIYMAGGKVNQIMFWVPQSGRLGLGVSILSYAGQVTLGVASDADLVPDPETIVASFHAEFEQLTRLIPQGEVKSYEL